MFILWGEWLTDELQSIDTQSIVGSVIITNTSITRIHVPNYSIHSYWQSGNRFTLLTLDLPNIFYKHNFPFEPVKLTGFDAEMQRYSGATLLLPVGSFFMLAVVVLLMVLFKRYPHMVAAIVAGILCIIIIFAILISVNHTSIYI